MANSASGLPTKEFFVEMLTRDIELSDAILDLLDNCLDGVVRQKNGVDKNTMDYYKGYFAKITIEKDLFSIEDNCGGIPRDTAERYAFRMGREAKRNDEETQKILPTVGIYGIGMKRAIFKIGKSADVFTRNEQKLYKVQIPIGWEQQEGWDFPIEDIEDDTILEHGGTKVEIKNIKNEVNILWGSTDKISKYVNDFIKLVRNTYGYILQKGFSIEINGIPVEAMSVSLLFGDGGNASIKPYIYKQTFEDVNVSLAVGFYAAPPSPEEIDEEASMKRASADAGWTVVCNDRVVLFNDKTYLTGWGEAGVPQYHTQFIGIRGIVFFESNNPKKLPMTTTKRGIDTSSSIYAAVKDRMREGLKKFTDYTNKWKGRNEQERVYSSAAKSVSITELTASEKNIEDSFSIKLRDNKKGKVYNPKLPSPPNDKPYRTISYSKGTEEILDVIQYIYKDRAHEITPSKVGEKCFDIILEKARQKQEGNS